MKKYLWEILVPVFTNGGDKVELEHHKQWDKEITGITGGLSIHKSIKGIWKENDSENEIHEKMIPVRIMCSKKEIEKIVNLTARHYSQKAIMYCRVSKKVHIKEFK